MTTSPRTYVKVARAEGEERTRTALLDAAEAAFFDTAWSDVSLDALAASARVTKPTLLRHFGSKDGLLEQAVRRAFEQVRTQRMAAPSGDIDGAVDNLLDHYEAVGERSLRVGAAQSGVLADVGREARRLHYDWVEHAFGPWLAGLTSPQRARVRAALIALCDVQTWAILAHELGLPRSEVGATLVVAIRRLLKEKDA